VQKDESINQSTNQSINESTELPGDGFGKNESLINEELIIIEETKN
jgi:hypothetical protein